jgi:zinc transport system ATP-binding protein
MGFKSFKSSSKDKGESGKMNKRPVIEINNVDFAYNDKNVLNNISMTINERDFHAIIGPNGGGKSTFIKIILGMLKPDKGSVKLFGKSIMESIKKVGYIPQNIRDENFPVTVKDVLIMGLNNDRTKSENNEILKDVVYKLNLAELLEKQIRELSGGQRQRVFIGRALAGKPEILILDEPTSSIDTEGQTQIYRLLKELNSTMTIVIVSHDLNVIVKYASSISVVNGTACYHSKPVLTKDIMDIYYQCPVDILSDTVFEKVKGLEG